MFEVATAARLCARHRVAAVLCLAGLLAAPAAWAQTAVPPDQLNEIGSFGIPAAEPYGRTLPGRLTHSHYQGIAVVRGGRILVMPSPEMYESTLLVAGVTDAIDIAIAPGHGEDGLDAIVFTTPNGLRATHRQYDALTGAPIGFSTPVSYGRDLFWYGAVRVRLADLDGNGFLDAYGIRGLGQDYIVVSYDVFEPTVNSHVYPVEPIGETATDIVAFRSSGSPTPSFAIQTSAGLVTAETDLSNPQLFAGDTADGVVEAFSTNGGDSVVWITPNALGEDVIHVYSGGSVTAGPNLGSIGVVAAAIGDYDQDQRDDLLINNSVDYSIKLLFNQGGYFQTGLPGVARTLDLAPGLSASTNTASPLLFDLDNDGDLDVGMPIHTTEMLELHHSVVVVARDYAPVFDGMDYLAEGAPDGDPPPPAYAELTVNLLPAPQEAALVTAGMTHIEVVVWEHVGGEDGTLIPTPVGRAFAPIGGDYEFFFHLESDVPGWNPDDLDGVYFWTQRYAELDAGLNTVAIGPSLAHALTTQGHLDEPEDALIYDWLLSIGTQITSFVVQHVHVPGGPLEDPDSVGTITEVAKPLPNSEDDEEPEDNHG